MASPGWLPHAQGSLSTAKGIVGYWFSKNPKARINEIREVAYTVFYPFGEIEPLYELRENLTPETLDRLAELAREHRRLYIFTDTHEKTYHLYSHISSKLSSNLVILDAHPDCFRQSKDEPVNYQNFLRNLVEEGKISPDKILLIGLRNPALEEISWLDHHDITYYTILDIITRSQDELLDEILEELRGSKVHLSLDMDALSCKACNWIEPLGVPESFLLNLVYQLRNDIAVLDITELDWNAPVHEKTYYLKLGLYLVLLIQAVKPWQRVSRQRGLSSGPM